MSEGTIHLVTEIRERIHLLARRMTWGKLFYGLAVFLGLVCTGIVLAVAFEALLWMPTVVRTIVFWLVTAFVVVAAAVFLAPPLASLVGLRARPDDESVARAVGQRFPEIGDRLLDLLQLASGHRSTAPEPLVDGAVAQLGQAVSSVDYRQVEQFADFRRAGRLAKWPLLGLVAFALVGPGTFGSAAMRLLAPGTNFLRPAPFRIVVDPGDVRLIKGDSLSITARLEGSELPNRAILAMKRFGENREETVDLRGRQPAAFSYTIPNIRNGFQYRVEAGAVTSATYRVAVSSRPFVRSMQLTLHPPRYTGLDTRRLAPDVGDVTALLGTKVDMAFDLAGEDIVTGEVVFDSAGEIPVRMSDTSAAAAFKLNRDDRYRIRLKSKTGIANENPIEYRIHVLHDQRPAIFVLSPALNSEFSDDLNVDVSARITDDFGFSGLSLYYRLAESRFGQTEDTFTELRLPRPAPNKLDQQIDYEWSLSGTGLDLVPGDVVNFYLEVRDNDAVSGFKAAASGMHTIRFPSLTDQFQAVDDKQDDIERTLQDLIQQSDSVKDSFRDLRESLQTEKQGDWEDKRSLERLKQRQADVEKKVSDLTEKMESLVGDMTEKNLLSPETLERFSELKKVVKEINSPELQDALNRLKDAMMNLDMTKLEKSLGDFQFNEEQFKDRIERALELFKRLRTEQQLEEAARRAEDLSNREKEMAEKTGQLSDKQSDEAKRDKKDERSPKAPGEPAESERKPDAGMPSDSANSTSQPDAEQLAREQEHAAEDMEQLEELMQKISEQMSEQPPSPTDEMERLQEQVKQEGVKDQLRQNANEIRKGQLPKAQQSQQQMQQSLQQLSQRLSQMQRQMSGQQMQANLAALRRTLDDVLTLSLEQESLRDKVRSLASRESGLRGFAQQQSDLEDGLKVVSDTLSRLSRTIPQMSREIQTHTGAASMDMQDAVDQMTDRRGRQAIGHQKSAMTNLNDLALLLSDLMQSLQSQQLGMGGMSTQQMMQQLQQMAGEQGQLNEQIQQFLNDVQGARLSQDMAARLQQMAAQQEALKKQLQEMNERAPELSKQLLGDLDQIARQMEKSVSEMKAHQVDRKTVKRQQEILTRLLDAQRSMQVRGREKRRESQTGKDVDRTGPPNLTPTERSERIRRELLKAIEAGYSADYQELIRRYFEALQQEQGAEQK